MACRLCHRTWNQCRRLDARDRGMRQLVLRTRALESGADAVPVVIRSRDEVGELALSFNCMVEELRTRERIKETFG
jgi:HAMP domain-containing protein